MQAFTDAALPAAGKPARTPGDARRTGASRRRGFLPRTL